MGQVIRHPGGGGGDDDGSLVSKLKRGLEKLDREREELVAAILEEEGDRSSLPYVPPEKLWLLTEEVMAERHVAADRVGIGLPGIDKRLDGGLYPGTLTAIQGAPGAGKTAFATQVALHLAGLGCSVACYFGDEGNVGAFVTICQQMGGSRAAALKNDAEALRGVLASVRAFPFFRLVRPSHPEATLERMVEGLVRLSPPGAPRVFLVDSAQVLRLASERSRESPVERVQRAVHELRAETLKHSLITLLVSRVHRGSFGKKKEEDETDPIAAAWGGATEWLAEVIIHLDGKPTPEEPKLRMRVPKNRISVSGPFAVTLRLDWPRKRFMEIDEEEEKREKDAKQKADFEEVKKRLLTGRDGVSGATIEREMKGRRGILREARAALAVEGKIHSRRREGRGGGEEWHLGPAPPAPSRPPSSTSGSLFPPAPPMTPYSPPAETPEDPPDDPSGEDEEEA